MSERERKREREKERELHDTPSASGFVKVRMTDCVACMCDVWCVVQVFGTGNTWRSTRRWRM